MEVTGYSCTEDRQSLGAGRRPRPAVRPACGEVRHSRHHLGRRGRRYGRDCKAVGGQSWRAEKMFFQVYLVQSVQSDDIQGEQNHILELHP